MVQVLGSDDDAVVLEDDARGLVLGGEFGGDVLAQLLAAGQGVGGETDFAADVPRLGKDAGVGSLAADAEAHQRAGMGVDDGGDVGPRFVDAQVEREFRGRRVVAFDGAVRGDADDVLRAEAPFVDAGRGDPHVAVFVPDRDVAARRGGHVVAVNPGHDRDDLIAWVQQGEGHGVIGRARRSGRKPGPTHRFPAAGIL